MTAFDEIEPLITAHPFTPEQKEAITSQGNVIVSAGAGSGKTSVMIARIINKLLLGAKLGEMLIVTFTRASAADMRVKLSQKLIAVKQGARDKNVRALASAALDDLSVCNIGTLHSYCQRLIKQYFFVAGLDPSATVCEDGEAKLIRQAAAKSAVRAALDGGDGVFCELYDMLCSRRSDDGAVQTVCDIMEFALSMPDPTAYLGGVRPDSEYAPELERILSARRADILDRAQRLKGELLRVKLQKAASVTDEFADYLDGKISELTRTSIAPKDDGQAEAKELFAAVKSDCEKLKKDIVAAKAAEKVDGEPYARRLCEVALDGCCRYASRKAALGKIDYSDFEHGAFRVLSDGVCMSEIVSSVKYVFVDEFQDVNPLQSAITDLFKAAGAEMFVVGDIKQSIYGFRRCSPEHFARAVERAQTMHDYRHISLAKNFRSSAPVIDFVNRVFCPIMKRDFGGVDYDTPEQKLVCGANIADGGASYVLLPAAEKSRASGEISPEPYSVKASAVGKAEHDPEAVFIADYIVDWLDKQNERARAQLKNGDPHVKMPALSDYNDFSNCYNNGNIKFVI